MKKFYFVLSFIIYIIQCFCSFIPLKAQASYEYKRVIDHTTPFFTNVLNEKPLFYLPYTYYVKVLNEVGEFSHVEIYGDGQIALDGFVPTNLLYFDGLQVLYPYLNLKVKALNTTILYADADLTEPLQYLFADRELTYYGEYFGEQGKVYYLSYNNKLGYVKQTDIYPFSIQNHPNELTFLPDEDQPEKVNKTTSKNDFFSLKFVILACLLFAGLFALFIALSNKSKSQTYNYYEENDYE